MTSAHPPQHGPAAEPPDAGLDLAILGQFRIIFRSVRKHVQSVEDRLGISGALLWALSIVAERPGINLTGLARAMSIHQSTASNILAKLCAQGLVRRERSQRDNRVAGLFVTETGAGRLGEAPGPVRGLLPDALGRLPEAARRDLHGNLQLLLEQMRTHEHPGESSSRPPADL